MVMKTILYIHGLSSSGASGTARHLQDLLPETRVIAPDLPIDPDEVLEMLHTLVTSEHPDMVIGTSMGRDVRTATLRLQENHRQSRISCLAHDATTDRRVFFPQSAKRWCNDLYDYP